MKKSITARCNVYNTNTLLIDKYGAGPKPIRNWVQLGVLPRPLRIGHAEFYRATEIESRLIEFGMR